MENTQKYGWGQSVQHCCFNGILFPTTFSLLLDQAEISLIILVMCILLQRISNPRDFVKYVSDSVKKRIAKKLLLCGKVKKVLSHAQVLFTGAKS